jgi:hypothetical protein
MLKTSINAPTDPVSKFYTCLSWHHGVTVDSANFSPLAVTRRPLLTRPEPEYPQQGINFLMSGISLPESMLFSFGEEDRWSKLLELSRQDLKNMEWVPLR